MSGKAARSLVTLSISVNVCQRGVMCGTVLRRRRGFANVYEIHYWCSLTGRWPVSGKTHAQTRDRESATRSNSNPLRTKDCHPPNCSKIDCPTMRLHAFTHSSGQGIKTEVWGDRGFNMC